MDAEFAVQYLVLSQSAEHPELLGNVGNIALLQRADVTSVLPSNVGSAAAAGPRSTGIFLLTTAPCPASRPAAARRGCRVERGDAAWW